LRWDVIQDTMFVGAASYVAKELTFLKKHPDWASRWRRAIQESPIGHPLRYPFFPASSGNLIHHAFHLAQFEEKTQIQVNNIGFVLEFGGGYGSMCRLLHNLGFHGKYVILDLPFFSLLQSFYLKSLGLPVHSIEDFKTANEGIVCVSEPAHVAPLF